MPLPEIVSVLSLIRWMGSAAGLFEFGHHHAHVHAAHAHLDGTHGIASNRCHDASPFKD